jgi:putative hydrolase of the HAD superfamily
MVKAIIFDCFGVLATEAWLPFKAEHFGADSERFEQASEVAVRVNRGLISGDDFIREIAQLSGAKPIEVSRAITGNVPNEPLFDYLKQLKPHYKLGFLSNIGGDRLNQIFNSEHLALFDVIALSFDIGFVKPEREAFEYMAEQLQVKSAECVLIDDQAKNVRGAEAVGMTGILYKDVPTLKKGLQAILADTKG